MSTFLGELGVLTPGYGAGVQLGFFVVTTTKKTDVTEVAHEPLVSFYARIHLKPF